MYAAALAELGFAVLGEGEFEGDEYVLFGRDSSDDFSIHSVGSAPGRDRATTGAHVAFTASDAAAVDRWHRALKRRIHAAARHPTIYLTRGVPPATRAVNETEFADDPGAREPNASASQ